MTSNFKKNWVSECKEGVGGWSSFLGIFFSATSLFSFITKAFSMELSDVFNALLETYETLIQLPILNILKIFNADLSPWVADLAVLWFAIGGMVFRTATTLLRQVSVLGSEAGFMIWIEVIVNDLKIRSAFSIIRSQEENSRNASVQRYDEATDEMISIRKGKGIWANMYIPEPEMDKSFVLIKVQTVLRLIKSVIILVVGWPFALIAIFRSPRLCHEFSGAKVLFGAGFPVGGKFSQILDLRRVFAFQVFVFIMFVCVFLIFNTTLVD